MAELGQSQTVLQDLDDRPRDAQPRGGAGGVGIGARGVGDDHHPDRFGVGAGGGDIAARRSDAAAHPPEQIHLVGHIRADGELAAVAVLSGQGLRFGRPPVAARGIEPHLRQPIRSRATQRSTRPIDPRDRLSDVGVGGERICDQPIEDGIVVQAPPVRGQGGGADDVGLGGEEGAGFHIADGGRGDMVRPRRAGRKHQRGNGGEEDSAKGHERCSYSAGSRVGRASPARGEPRSDAIRSPSARQTT